jgi:hypothetical protein
MLWILSVFALLAIALGGLGLDGSSSANAGARIDSSTSASAALPAAGETTTVSAPVALARGGNLVGWFGFPTTSADILAGNSDIEAIWVFNVASQQWDADAPGLPAGVGVVSDVTQGSGLFVITARATTLMVPTSTTSTETLMVFQDETGAIAANFGMPTNGEVTLTRTLTGLSATYTSNDLKPGDTYTAWFIIFNNPAGCVDGCDESDLANAAAEASAVNADGLVAGATGSETFNASLAVGDAGHHQIVFGDGITDPIGAEVQTFIRNHGPELADPSEVNEQISILAGGCTLESSVDGTGTGPNTCFDPHFAVFSGGNTIEAAVHAFSFPPFVIGDVLEGADAGSGTLVRSTDGVSMTLRVNGLDAGAYTFWWVFFNPDGSASANWAVGGVVGVDGVADVSASIETGATRTPFDPNNAGPGLLDPLESNIAVVVKYHGPALTGDDLIAQTTSPGGGCDVDSAPEGTTTLAVGEGFACIDPQVALFGPRSAFP